MKRTMQILVVTAGIILCLTGLASAAEKSVILGFHEKPGPSEQALIHGAKGIIKKTFNLIPAMAVSLPEEEIAALKQNSRVAYINEDAIFTAVEPVVSDEYINSWGVYRIFSDVAHFSGNKGAGVNIAVLDTGIDYTHSELAGNYRGGYDFVYNDNDP
ncbi:MAG: protease inhibitor I9 family protein, partial [Bacteroidales bacterium]|nr:protease inhibitor I9 family protein [Bacteroidales bacterium]